MFVATSRLIARGIVTQQCARRIALVKPSSYRFTKRFSTESTKKEAVAAAPVEAPKKGSLIVDLVFVAFAGVIGYNWDTLFGEYNVSINPSDWFPLNPIDKMLITDQVFEEIQSHPVIKEHVGLPIAEYLKPKARPKTFLIEEDMSTGYLVRFRLLNEKTGPWIVHAELSNLLPKGVYRYAFVQNLVTGKAYLLQDNRLISQEPGLRTTWNNLFKVIYVPALKAWLTYIDPALQEAVDKAFDAYDSLMGNQSESKKDDDEKKK